METFQWPHFVHNALDYWWTSMLLDDNEMGVDQGRPRVSPGQGITLEFCQGEGRQLESGRPLD
jgi:hypothetical protein